MGIARPICAAAVCAALLATAACSSGTSRGTSHTNGDIAPTPTAKAYGEAVKSRQQATVAYAQQLVDHAPQIAGEIPLTTTPPHNLQNPDETIGAADLVVRARYWTAPGTADHVYRALKKAPAEGLVVSGHGLPSSPAEDLSGRGFLNYPLTDPPAYIEGGELYVEMEPAGHARTVIAAYSEVYSHPVRYPIEHLSVSSSTATASWPTIVNGKVVGHPSEALTDDQVMAVVDGFNRSPVANGPNVCFGAIGGGGRPLEVTVTENGDTWKLTYPGTSCFDLAVTRDGVQLPAIEPDDGFRHLLRVLSHSGGTIVGHLLMVGGPSGAAPTPATGTTMASAHGQTVATVHTRSAQGYFLLSAPPGRYTLTGTSRSYQIDGRPGRCTATHPVVVRTDRTTHADIYCQRK